MEAAGKYDQAQRLRLAGAEGYPGMDELEYFAAEVGGRIELYLLDEPEATIPTGTYGVGDLKMRIGHTQVYDADYVSAEHWVLVSMPKGNTKRQDEVADLLSQGTRPADIARKLGISKGRVSQLAAQSDESDRP